jgi:membrane-associated phospholipid phosphatase
MRAALLVAATLLVAAAPKPEPMPERAGPILARPSRYAQSRIVCEQHFRSDLAAGQQLGTLVAERLRAKPAFTALFAAARQELVAASITR